VARVEAVEAEQSAHSGVRGGEWHSALLLVLLQAARITSLRRVAERQPNSLHARLASRLVPRRNGRPAVADGHACPPSPFTSQEQAKQQEEAEKGEAEAAAAAPAGPTAGVGAPPLPGGLPPFARADPGQIELAGRQRGECR